MKKRYYSNWFEVLFTSAALIVAMGLAVYGRGIDDHLLVGIGLSVSYIIYTIIQRYGMYVEFLDGRTLKSAGKYTFRSDVVDILSIKWIARASVFPVKGWGSLVIIYIVNDRGELRQINFRELSYSQETIAAIIHDLREINPYMRIDPTYESLLNGTLPKRLHSIPSQHTPAEVDAHVREELGIKEKGSV